MYKALLNLVAPVNCLGCGAEGMVICADCRNLVAPRPPACYRCNKYNVEGRTCATCKTKAPLAGVTVGAFYEGLAKDLVWRLKFDRLVAGAEAGASLIAPLLPPLPFDVVTSIPSSPRRFRQRGYNQSALVAKAVAKNLSLPYRELLGRHRHIEQIGSSRQERFEQVAGSFTSLKRIPNQRVLIVDDVLTTGATLAECSRVLKTAGAKQVWGAVIAKH